MIIIGYVLTVILIGTPISFRDDCPVSLEECRKEGIRQVRDYQTGNIRAQYECEPIEVKA